MDRTRMAVSVFDRNAALYQEKYKDVSQYRHSLDLFCREVRQNAEVLELACGPGNVTRYLLDHRPDLQVLSTDLAPKMLELARVANPEAVFELMDCRAMKTLERQFDAIIASFVMPYLSKEEAIQLIRDTAVMLRAGGVCYISTMEDDYGKSGLVVSSSGEQVYMYYHQSDYLLKAVETEGFMLTDLRRQHLPSAGGTDMTDLIIIAVKP